MNKDAIMAAIAFGSSKPGTVVEASVVQTTGTSATSVMSQKATTDALALKQNAADPAGLADNLTPYSADSGAMQDIPFIAQGTGCGNGESIVDTGSYAQIKKKLGNTVGVNQLVDWKTTADLGITPSIDANGVVTLSGTTTTVYANVTKTYLPIVGHKYLVTSRYIANPTNQTTMYWGFFNTQSSPTAPSCLIGTSQIITMQNVSGDRTGLAGFASNTDLSGTKLQVYCVDLTLWFGSNDRIPSDLLSHPENWGRYYAGSLAYDAGHLENADGTVMKSIGRNVWDEEWENGGYDTTDGTKNNSSNRIRCKNYIPCSPNTTYYVKRTAPFQLYYYDQNKAYLSYYGLTSNNIFTTPANCGFITFQTGSSTTPVNEYNHDITISLYYSGESGYDQYYPYTVLAQIDTGSEVLRSAGAVADEKTPDGTITRRVGTVDLGSLSWTYDATTYSFPYFYTTDAFAMAATENLRCAKYVTAETSDYFSNNDMSIRYVSSTQKLRIRNSAYSNAAAFKTAMSGVYLYYELATPTTEQGTAFAENIPCDDFGSLMWTQTKGIPQGNEIFYPVDYKASIDTLYNRVGGDMSRIVIDDDLNSYNTKTEDDAKFATKDAVGGTLRQLLAVSANINFADTTWVDLGTLTWTQSAGGAGKYYANLPEQYVIGATVNMLCSAYSFAGAQSTHYQTDKSFDCYSRSSASSPNQVYFRDDSISTVAGFTAAMKGQLLAYEKASS